MAKESQSRASRHDSKKAAAAYKGPKQKKPKGKRTIGSILLRTFMGLFFLGCLGDRKSTRLNSSHR